MIEFIGNRAAKAFQRAVNEIEYENEAMVTYWDTFAGPLPNFDDSRFNPCLRILPRALTNPIDDKGQLGEILRARSDLLPCTYSNPSEIPYVRARPDGLWFIKNRHGAGSKQVSCARYSELNKIELGANDILQQAIPNPELIEGRKYTIRCYMLIWNGCAFLHRFWYRFIHSEPYQADTTDYGVQVSQRYGGDGTKFEPVTETTANARFTELLRVNREIAREFNFLIEESDRESYSILGCDFIIDSSGRARMIEVNAYPNLAHSDKRVADEVIYPMIRDAVAMMVRGEIAGDWIQLT